MPHGVALIVLTVRNGFIMKITWYETHEKFVSLGDTIDATPPLGIVQWAAMTKLFHETGVSNSGLGMRIIELKRERR